jgi:hypothetical protein
MREKYYLVIFLDGEELDCETRLFTDKKKAENCFKRKLFHLFNKDGISYTEEDIQESVEIGWYADQGHSSLILREIEVE